MRFITTLTKKQRMNQKEADAAASAEAAAFKEALERGEVQEDRFHSLLTPTKALIDGAVEYCTEQNFALKHPWLVKFRTNNVVEVEADDVAIALQVRLRLARGILIP